MHVARFTRIHVFGNTVNPVQEELQIADTIHAAIAADVTALGGVKKVAKPLLWPTKDEVTAQDRLRAAINEKHDQELHPDQLETIVEAAAKVGSYAIASYYARKAKGQFVRVEPRTRVEQLVSRVESLETQCQATFGELRSALADLRESEREKSR